MQIRLLAILLTFLLGMTQSLHAQRPHLPFSPTQPEKPATGIADPEKLSDADRISRIQRGIDESLAELSRLRDTLNDPNSEYRKAETDFGNLDSQYEAERKELHRLKGENGPDLQAREAAQAELDAKRRLARERFDLAIKERKAIQDQVGLLEQKVQQDREALNKLVGSTEPKAVPNEAAAGATPGTQPAASDASQPQAPAKTGEPAAASTSTSTTSPAPVDPAQLLNPLAQPQITGAVPAAASAEPAKPPSEKLVKAQETATSKQAEADEAQQQAVSVTQRLDSIRKVIQNENELRRTARKKAANAKESLEALKEEQSRKWAEGTPFSQLRDLREKIDDAEKRVNEAEEEIRTRGETLDARNSELVALQSEQIAALEQAKRKMEEAEAARAELEHLKNPFAPENIWHWVVNHAPKIGATIVLAIILLWLIQVMESRMVRFITKHGVTGTHEDRESRARTLAGVLQNAGTVIVVVGALLIVIAESGFNITALLGATAVIGLAVAFGAQNLIRDYFYGFMILMENQYLVNDVVRLGTISGQVERITLRITVLRDLRGTVHFVPHGQITTVSNLTRGWARAVLDVGVAYKEDVDRVIKVLADLGKEMRRDPAYRDLILDEPEVSGVDALSDSAVVVRFLIKTRPQKQWLIKREMLRRIKNKFDEVGIEIPFPHQVVYNRFESGSEHQARLLDGPTPGEESEEWTTPRSAAS